MTDMTMKQSIAALGLVTLLIFGGTLGVLRSSGAPLAIDSGVSAPVVRVSAGGHAPSSSATPSAKAATAPTPRQSATTAPAKTSVQGALTGEEVRERSQRESGTTYSDD